MNLFYLRCRPRLFATDKAKSICNPSALSLSLPQNEDTLTKFVIVCSHANRKSVRNKNKNHYGETHLASKEEETKIYQIEPKRQVLITSNCSSRDCVIHQSQNSFILYKSMGRSVCWFDGKIVKSNQKWLLEQITTHTGRRKTWRTFFVRLVW